MRVHLQKVINMEDFDYATHVARNDGYVSVSLQARMRDTTLMIAGCGIGSSLAICAARMGFERFILVDADTVSSHNLNRQFYDLSDVGRSKVDALRDGLLAINPTAQVHAVNQYLTADNVGGLVAQADLIFDTVDFLDLPAIVELHDEAHRQRKPILTALSVGFGALVWYFAPDANLTLGQMLASDHQPAEEEHLGPQGRYAQVFERFVARLAPYLDDEVNRQIATVLTRMRDGIPCPASQVAVGSFAIAAMAMTMIADLLDGRAIPAAPRMVLHSFRSMRTQLIELD